MGPILPRSLGQHRSLGGRGDTHTRRTGPRPPSRPRSLPFAPLSPTRPLALPSPPRRARGRRRLVTGVLVLVVLGAGFLVVRHLASGPPLSPLRARIVAVAQGQVGYTTDPSDTYCNKFSAYWYAGTSDCGNDNRREEWCADFAAWVWQRAGAEVAYQLAPGYLNGNSASFYVWGANHGTWHPV